MEKVHYKCVEETFDTSWKPLMRQLLVCSGVWMHYFSLGLCLGSPTVFIPQLRREANSTTVVSEDMASWLTSVFGYAGLPWVFVFPALARIIGRKIPFIIVCVNSIAGFIAFYISNNAKQLLISEIILSMLLTSNITVSILIFTEYTSPKYRGVFLTIKSATVFWGLWAANAIGTFFHWKNIGLLGIVCSCLSLVVFSWPESPFWLATKGRFEECAASYRWLNGISNSTERELDELIQSQRQYLSSVQTKRQTKYYEIKECVNSMTMKEFRRPILLSMLMMTLYQLTGKTVCSMYAIDIIKQITVEEYTAYRVMLILDGITVLGMYFGCFLTKSFKRRALLFTTSSIGITFLCILSLYLYLVKLNLVPENKIISVVLLIMFSMAISCGPMIMASSIYAELIPLRFKSTAVLITALFSHTLLSTILKLSPLLIRALGLPGAFLFYALSSSICILLLFKYLPETKNKTLQEIEQYFRVDT